MALGSIAIYIFVIIYVFLELFKIVNPIKIIIQKYRLYLIYTISFLGSVGSIMLTSYFMLDPCELCWYQRAFLFCIPVISIIAIIKKDITASLYVFYLSIIGSIFAVYHNLLQFGIIKTESIFCGSLSNDCITAAFTYFGFVTIPVMSLSIFLILILISYESHKKQK